MSTTTTNNPTTGTSGGGCGCSGCGCGTTSAGSAATTGATTSASYRVTGLTCWHCVKAITEQLLTLPGATSVNIDLVPGGTSTIHLSATGSVERDALAFALREAGDYTLA